jgi:hypothetical protein
MSARTGVAGVQEVLAKVLLPVSRAEGGQRARGLVLAELAQDRVHAWEHAAVAGLGHMELHPVGMPRK